ncbi:helix-turn-helix transcriptional regulator [Agrococcus terreus]|uniref:helix-turn-helix transcriptional regulator n=1 Tax=Agrococcus terreus TaxID=574649 RepID=UPI00166622D9|nr:LuxR C-terminal-related transcriptional regulator [Agrococcus terreus]
MTADGFPGDAIVLIEEPGPPLLAHARTAIAAGAVVVVLVDAEPSLADELAEAGAVVLPADTDGYALSASIRDARHPGRRRGRMGVGPARPRLSPRERRALAYYVQGRTTVQVADEMQVGYETAKTFLRRVRAKYAALDRPAGKRSELIVRAEEDGIL